MVGNALSHTKRSGRSRSRNCPTTTAPASSCGSINCCSKRSIRTSRWPARSVYWRSSRIDTGGSYSIYWDGHHAARTRHEVLSPTDFLNPPLDETTNLLVLGAGQRAPVTFPRFVAAAEPTEDVGTSEVERRVLFQGAAARHAL